MNKIFKKGFLKPQRGITLIALVITIIVLLILAGVSLSLVTGNNGILGKAKTSADRTKEASAKEQVELKIAEYQTEYYYAVYVNKDGTADVNTKKGEWIAQNKTGEQKTEDYTFTITGSAPYKVTIKKDKTIKSDIEGSLSEDGILSWASSGGGTLFSQIGVGNYGEYVDLETSLIVNDNIALEDGKKPTTDWRIFHKDTNGTWLILADYLPYSYETGATAGSSTGLATGLLNYGTDYPYNWKSETSRSDLLTRLEDSTAWNKLLPSEYTSKEIIVTGAIELETYKESWNAKGHKTMYLAGDDTNGYYVGVSENPEGSIYCAFNNSEGYSDTLYYPHKNDTSRSKVSSYWLASPCGPFNYEPSGGGVMCVCCTSYVAPYGYNYSNSGIRPAVFLPSDILAEKNATTGVWEIK